MGWLTLAENDDLMLPSRLSWTIRLTDWPLTEVNQPPTYIDWPSGANSMDSTPGCGATRPLVTGVGPVSTGLNVLTTWPVR